MKKISYTAAWTASNAMLADCSRNGADFLLQETSWMEVNLNENSRCR